MVTAVRAKRRSAAAVADEVLIAQRDALVCAVRDLLTLVDPKAYLFPEQQHALRNAQALVAEYGKEPR